jgi:aminobenzoyl-glutamate transport protein
MTVPDATPSDVNSGSDAPVGVTQRFLNVVEWAGNKLPDPAFLFVLALLTVWLSSKWLAPTEFAEVDPRTGVAIKVVDQLSGKAFADFLANMVKTFVEFPPLGVVLVALLGVGVAEHTGFIQAMLKGMLKLTPTWLLTPMLVLVALLSHSAGDTGYVLIIPLGAVMFSAAGRHPVLGITAAFAGVSGGFSANFLPSSLDPLLQGFTQKAAQIIDPAVEVNPLCNYWFMTASSILIVGVGWYVTDRIIEPRLRRMPVDGLGDDGASMQGLSDREVRGLWVGLGLLALGLIALAVAAWPNDSPLRADVTPAAGSGGAAAVAANPAALATDPATPATAEAATPAVRSLTSKDAPMMKAIVPLIFVLFLLPGIAYGYAAGTVKSHRDIVQGMTKSMGSINYYLVMAFFAAQFTAAFSNSNIGVLLAVKGANTLAAMQMPSQVTIVGIILLTTAVNLLIGSASAKWALLSPIFVPMLMTLGLSPELTQAAYRIGDSSTNIITPLMPYFPLVVVYAQKYVKNTGIGTLISLMLPYSMAFLVAWTVLLMFWWGLGLPLGLQAGYTYIPAG